MVAPQPNIDILTGYLNICSTYLETYQVIFFDISRNNDKNLKKLMDLIFNDFLFGSKDGNVFKIPSIQDNNARIACFQLLNLLSRSIINFDPGRDVSIVLRKLS
jgi:hypothetical protein